MPSLTVITIFSGSIGSYSPVFMKNNPILATKELQPVSGTAAMDWFVFVRSDLGINSLRDLAAYAKGQQGQDAFRGACIKQTPCSWRPSPRSPGGLFDNTFDIIPYKSTDQTIQAILSGDVQATVNVLLGF